MARHCVQWALQCVKAKSTHSFLMTQYFSGVIYTVLWFKISIYILICSVLHAENVGRSWVVGGTEQLTTLGKNFLSVMCSLICQRSNTSVLCFLSMSAVCDFEFSQAMDGWVPNWCSCNDCTYVGRFKIYYIMLCYIVLFYIILYYIKCYIMLYYIYIQF